MPLPITDRKPPLPPKRIPRKHAIRLRKELLLFGLIFIALTYVLKLLRLPQHPAVASDAAEDDSQDSDQYFIQPSHTTDDLREIPRNVYYLTKEPVQFCYIPKNACSALKPLLRKREGYEDWADTHMIHGKRNGLHRLQWLSRGEAINRLNSTDVYRFVVVRDPFARLVSAWQNKVASPWPDQRWDFWHEHLRKECPSMVDAREMPYKGPLMSLLDFLKCLNSQDTMLPSNEHWRAQTELCALDHVQYARYLRLESFAEDVTSLLSDLAWDEDRSAFQFDRQPVYEKDLAEFFDEQSIQLALQYYKKDFEVLRYPRVPQGKIGFYSVYNGTNFHPDFNPSIIHQKDDDERPEQHDDPDVLGNHQ